MPKSIQERLAHADSLADIFENYEPRPEDGRDAAPFRALLQAIELRAAGERAIIDAIGAMRDAKYSWSFIGGYLGTSGQAAQQRYGRRAHSKQQQGASDLA